MPQTTFKTNPLKLRELLEYCGNGRLQLPDFQRNWVWDEGRIRGLLASVSRAFPVGALMTLEMKASAAETFAYRTIEGIDPAKIIHSPNALLLDGQQRMTSLYQACFQETVVTTITPGKKLARRWFYIDMMKALIPGGDREEAILSIPEDRVVREDFGRKVALDLSTREKEYINLVFPMNRVFDFFGWMRGFVDFWNARGDSKKWDLFNSFKEVVLDHFDGYHVPVIALGDDTSHEAVCLVFEKVNTAGKALDAFELVTAMYAAKGYRLRDDWFGVVADSVQARPIVPGIQKRLHEFGHAADQRYGILEKVASTDLLQAIALLHSKQVRAIAEKSGVKEGELPSVRATKQSLLDLPLEAYLAHCKAVEDGFRTVAKFLRQLHIYRTIDLPYQTQLVPLAAIFAEIGAKWENATICAKLKRWYWCGVFGELYGSAIESRFAKDIQEVPAWLEGGLEPSTVREGVIRADRLRTMRTRLSAAYKGVHALLMEEGARDFRTGQTFDHNVFFDDAVDIHHIFPEKWCREHDKDVRVYDSIINKTPLGARTNRIIGGVAPSEYLIRLENGTAKEPRIGPDSLNEYLRSHSIDPSLLRADDFDAFMADRERRLLALIVKATGHGFVVTQTVAGEGDEVPYEIARDTDAVPLAAD